MNEQEHIIVTTLYLDLQEAEVIKIQAFLRAKKDKKDYKQLGKSH